MGKIICGKDIQNALVNSVSSDIPTYQRNTIIDNLKSKTQSFIINYIGGDGNEMWGEWKTLNIRDNESWYDGFQQIYNSRGRSNFINIKTGEILLDEWYLNCASFHCGVASVMNEESKRNFVKTDGTLVSEKWYDFMYEIGNYFAVGNQGEGMTFLDRNGHMPIYKTWKHALYFNGQYGLVRHDENQNVTTLIDKKGNEIADINMNCVIITRGNAIIAFEDDMAITIFNIDGDYLLPPKLKFTRVNKKEEKPNCWYLENERTREIYEFNLETNEVKKL